MAKRGEDEKPATRSGATEYFTSKTPKWKQLLQQPHVFDNSSTYEHG